jgi:hypothetical protein
MLSIHEKQPWRAFFMSGVLNDGLASSISVVNEVLSPANNNSDVKDRNDLGGLDTERGHGSH